MATAKPNYRELRRAYESLGSVEARRDFEEMFRDRKIRENFSFREAAYECLGREHYWALHQRQRFDMNSCYETAGAVGTDAFLDIASQFMYSNLYDGYVNEEEFVFTSIIGERKATNTKGEKCPTYTDLTRPTGFRQEREAFAEASFDDDWIFTPQLKDRGHVLSLTEEAIFDDKVGDIAGRDKAIGYRLGVDREIDAINAYIDENSTGNGGYVVNYPDGATPWRHNWKGTVIATYGDNSGNHTWDNQITDTLVDWTDLNSALQAFYALVNPYTGLPIEINPRHLVVPKVLEPTARRIIRATEVRYGQDVTASPWVTTIGDTPIPKDFQLVSTKLLSQRLADSTTANAAWFLGDIAKTVQCMMAFPPEVLEAVPMNPDHFYRRIVKQWRFANMYAYTVWQPRASVQSTGS